MSTLEHASFLSISKTPKVCQSEQDKSTGFPSSYDLLTNNSNMLLHPAHMLPGSVPSRYSAPDMHANTCILKLAYIQQSRDFVLIRS
jgi:hypothetical protein